MYVGLFVHSAVVLHVFYDLCRPTDCGRPGGCRTNNLTNKTFYVHITSTFVNVKSTKTQVEKMHTLWSVDSREN